MPNVKLIAAVVHELVTPHLFDGWVDLSEAVKDRCVALHIAYDSGTITEAVKLVERTRPVFVPLRRAMVNPRHVERIDEDVRPLSRAEAADLYTRLCAAVVREQTQGRRRA